MTELKWQGSSYWTSDQIEMNVRGPAIGEVVGMLE